MLLMLLQTGLSEVIQLVCCCLMGRPSVVAARLCSEGIIYACVQSVIAASFRSDGSIYACVQSVVAARLCSDGSICVGGKAVVVAEDKLLNYNLIYEKP